MLHTPSCLHSFRALPVISELWLVQVKCMLATQPNSFLAADVNFKVSSEVEPPAPQVKSVNRGPKASVRSCHKQHVVSQENNNQHHTSTTAQNSSGRIPASLNFAACSWIAFIFTIRFRKFSTPSGVFGGKYSKENQPATGRPSSHGEIRSAP